MHSDDMTLADHAEAWWAEQGFDVPERDTLSWNVMYMAWFGHAFGHFPNDRPVETC